MRHLRASLTVAVLTLGLAACGESSSSVVAPDAPSLDGGPTIGSGSRTGTTSDSTSAGGAGGGPTIGSGS